jgi:hypothetical protein
MIRTAWGTRWVWPMKKVVPPLLGYLAEEEKSLTRRRERAKQRRKEVFREFPGPSCAVAQDVLWKLGCLGVLRLDGAWDGVKRVDGKIPKRCQATAVQERRIRNLTRRREGAKGLGVEFRSCPRRFEEMRVSWSAPA